MGSIGWWIAGGAGVLAWLTNPPLEAHQRHVDAIIAEMKQNRLSSLELGSYARLTALDAGRSGRYENLLVMSKYTMGFSGTPLLVCHGVFGQIFCGLPE